VKVKVKNAKLNLASKVVIIFVASIIPVNALNAQGTCIQTSINNLTPTARSRTNVRISNNARLTDTFGNSYSTSFFIYVPNNPGNPVTVTYGVSNFDTFTGTIATASGNVNCRAQIQIFANNALVFTSNVFNPNGSTPPQAFNIDLRNVSTLRIEYRDAEGTDHWVSNTTAPVATIFNGQFNRIHTPGSWVTVRGATCTQVGLREQSCTVCRNVVLSQDIPMIPHVPSGGWVVAREPTCTVAGEEKRDCQVCGGIAIMRTIQMLPHTASGNWVILAEASCNTAGRRVQYCTISGSIATDEVIPAITGLPHVFERNIISGNVFIPPIVSGEICEVCGFIVEHTNWFFAWVSPSILAAIVATGIIFIKVKKKIRKGKKFVCPYCFDEHLVQEVQFRCANLNCNDVDDIELTKYEGGNISSPLQRKKTFPAPVSKNYDLPKFANCPDCNRETSKVVCPSCHNSLPESSLTGEDMIISIVGSRDVGKSHYIGIIIHELIERVAGRFEGVLTGFDDTMTRYEENFGRNLYVELTKLNLTQSSTIIKNKPLIFSLTIKHNNKIRKFTLVFFDTAGEDLNTFDTMNTVNRYICKSVGIIFLLDPMQIWTVRNQLADEIVSRASSVAIQQAARPDDIMTRVSELIRNDKRMESTKKIGIPVAAVFSKFDAIIPLIPPGNTILDSSPHCDAGAFVMSDWHNVNNEIKSLLKTWGATAFVQQLELNYTNYCYFAASALGLDNSPRNDGRIDRPRPHRIEDALLWILKENGILEAKK
jgi:hypothetical protein